jgi:TRAP-type C4-dicarboxylate transport system substrate-binding protein
VWKLVEVDHGDPTRCRSISRSRATSTTTWSTRGTYIWKRLSLEQQAIFREESAAAANLMRRLTGEQETELIGRLEAAGIQVTRPDLAPFRARMEPAYKRIATYAGEANVKKFLEMVEKARQV